MSLMCDPIDVTLAALTSSTVSDSSTTWTYTLVPATNASYLDPVTRHLFKTLTAGASKALTTGDFDSTTNKVNWTAHGRANGNVFAFALSGGGAVAPAGLTVSTPYYLVNTTANDFQLALTPDGDPIDFTTNGTAGWQGYINGAFDNPEDWQDRGVPNRYLMFAPTNKAATVFSGSCQVVVAPTSRIDTIAAHAMRNVSELYIAASGTNTSRTNQILQSCSFDHSAWTKANASVAANAVRAPNGTMTADKLVGNGTNGVHTISQACTNLLKSVYVQAGELTKGTFSTTSTSGWFDLTDGTITINSGPDNFYIERLNNSRWYRIWTTTSSANITIGLRNAAGADSFVGSASQGFYVWCAQAEAANFDGRPTGPIITTGSSSTTSTDTHIEVYDLTDESHPFRQAATYPRTRYRRDVATSEIPLWANQSIAVTLVSPGTGSIVMLDFAASEDIGAAEYDSSVGLRSASKTEPDEFNNINPVVRPSAKRGDWGIVLPEQGSDVIKGLIDDADGLRKVWLMAPDDREATGFQWKQRGIITGLGKAALFKFFKPKHDKLGLQTEGYI